VVLPLLRALGNGRGKAVIASAIPDPETPLGFGGLATTLERLGYDVSHGPRARARWRQPIDGAIVAQAPDGSVAAFVKQAGRILAVEASKDGMSIAPAAPIDPDAVRRSIAGARQVMHVRPVFAVPLTEFDEDLRHVLTAGFVVSLFINLIALAIPFLTMVVYDRVIGGSAPEILPGLAVGGLLTMAAILVLRRGRAQLLAAAHARFGFALQRRVVHRLLRAPIATAGRFQGNAVLARVREAWRAVDPLSHAMSTAVFDAPFILLNLIAIACVGGFIVLVPVAYLGLFLGLALLLERRSRLDLHVAGTIAAEREAMLAELTDKAVQLRLAGLEDVWLARFAEVSRRATASAMRTATRSAFTQSVATVLGTGVALATLAVGVDLVLREAMTAGGLIATMLLVWRITGPAQALFFSLGRLRQARAQRARLAEILQSPVETDQPTRLHNAQRNVPVLRFDRIGYRHPGAAEQALSGVSFAVAPGEVVAVLGPTGCGKTTVLQIAAGLLTPQVGAVLVDGENLTHIDPDDYRLTVAAYVPARPHVFRASIRDNIAVAAPWIDDAQATAAVLDAWPPAEAGAMVAALHGSAPETLTSHVSPADTDRLGLARVIARPPRIVIADMPFLAAGEDARSRFEALVARSRGTASVLFSTDDPSQARMADKVLVLDAGQAVYFGPPAVNGPTPPPMSPS